MEDVKHSIECTRSIREMQPAQYTLRIDSFSLLSRILLGREVDYYESSDFETGGYKWRLVLHFNGNNKENIDDHISLYLKISEANDLPLGWEVHAIIKFLVHDQARDNFLCIEDGKMRRFHSLKKQWGISRLLSLGTLNDESNGYLIDDSCVFGVEVFVRKHEGNGQCVSLIKEPEGGKFTWKLDKFSKLNDEEYYSDKFTVEGIQWKLSLCPYGESSENRKSLSLFLELDDDSDDYVGSKVYAEYKLLVKDQLHGKHKKRTCTGDWFSTSSPNWGFPSFMPLSDLNDVKKGFIVDDTLIVSVKITLISAIKHFA